MFCMRLIPPRAKSPPEDSIPFCKKFPPENFPPREILLKENSPPGNFPSA